MRIFIASSLTLAILFGLGGQPYAATGAKPDSLRKAGLQFKRALGLFQSRKWRAAARLFEESVRTAPKSADAPAALNNAAVCYERVRSWYSAVGVYDQIWRRFPKSVMAIEAIWRSAVLKLRLSSPSEAADRFLILMKRYPTHRHYNDALFNVAAWKEKQKSHVAAFGLYLRYARRMGKSKDAVQACERAIRISGKPKITRAMLARARRLLKASRPPPKPKHDGRVGGPLGR